MKKKKILQTYLPINYEVKTESDRRWLWGPIYVGRRGACLEASIQEINKQQAFLKMLLFTLHIGEKNVNSPKWKILLFFS